MAACSEYAIEAARARCLAATRDIQGVIVLVNECAAVNPKLVILPTTSTLPEVTLGNAQTAMGNMTPTVIDYDHVDDDVNQCPLLQTIIKRYSEWQNSDVTVRVHFARQTLRYAMQFKNWEVIQTVQGDDNWMWIKMGLRIFGDLKRIGLTKERKDDNATIIGAAQGIDTDPAWLSKYQFYLSLAGTVNITSGVVPASGLGVFQAMLTALQNIDTAQSGALGDMTARLPQMDEFKPNDVSKMNKICVPCIPTGCGFGLSLNSPLSTENPVGGVHQSFNS